MIDLKVIRLRDFAQVTKLDYLDRASVEEFFDTELLQLSEYPIMMVAEGSAFSRAVQVLINGHSVQFTIVSDKKMFITLTDVVASQAIESVFVITDRDSFINSSLFEFEVGNIPSTQAGPQKLISQFVKLLLTTPGSDSFDKASGGGMQKIPGSITMPPHMALAQVAVTIHKVADQIRAKQENIGLPNSEKLQSVDILRLNFAKKDRTHIEVMLRIRTMDNSSLPAALLLGAQNLLQEILG